MLKPGVQFALCPPNAPSRTQPASHTKALRLFRAEQAWSFGQLGRERDGRPEVERHSNRPGELLRRDADHVQYGAANGEFPSDDGGVAAKLVLPRLVADH